MFKNLVRRSRVFSLPEVEAGSASVPHQQVLKTTSASKHKRNWGIKYNLPTKASATLVTHQALDSNIGMPEVEYGGRHTRRLQKFVETGAPVQLYSQTSMFNSDVKRQKTLHDLSKKDRKNLFRWASENRGEFIKALPARANVGSPTAYRGLADSFCGLGSRNAERTSATRSVLGLTYALKGTARNTPQGIRSELSFPARLLAYNLSNTKASSIASAGFVGSFNGRPSDSSSDEVVTQQRVRTVYISQASARIDGQVGLKLNEAAQK